jgi:hypothetical protein
VRVPSASAITTMTMPPCIHRPSSCVAETARSDSPWLETAFVALGRRGNGLTPRSEVRRLAASRTTIESRATQRVALVVSEAKPREPEVMLSLNKKREHIEAPPEREGLLCASRLNYRWNTCVGFSLPIFQVCAEARAPKRLHVGRLRPIQGRSVGRVAWTTSFAFFAGETRDQTLRGRGAAVPASLMSSRTWVRIPPALLNSKNGGRPTAEEVPEHRCAERGP